MATRTSKSNLIRLEKKQQQQICKRSTLFGRLFCRHCTITTGTCSISRFIKNVNKRRRIPFSLFELEYCSLDFNSRRIRLHLTKWASWNNPLKFQRTRSPFHMTFSPPPPSPSPSSVRRSISNSSIMIILAARRELTRPQSSLSCLYSLIIYQGRAWVMRAGKMGRREKADSSPVVSKLSLLTNYLPGKSLGHARGEDGKAREGWLVPSRL